MKWMSPEFRATPPNVTKIVTLGDVISHFSLVKNIPGHSDTPCKLPQVAR